MQNRQALNRLDVEKPINALSASPDGEKFVIAGRDVLQIVEIDDEGILTEALSLRPTAKTNLSYSTIDAQWHPHEINKIATAATNGAVVIWNVQRDGKTQKQERVINDHSRTVNRICWQPSNPNNLLSASQDGTMKLWDTRDPAAKALTFSAKSTSVRDVQFSPFYSNYFGAAFDNGTIQVWDVRKGNACERKITAHQGLVMTICWHPEERSIIGSGGRDGMIKVWDLNPRSSNPKHSIQTIASVGRILWRPGQPTQIASSASLIDMKIHIWDCEKPYIPLYSLTGHRDVATGFLWRKNSADVLVSCSKDGTLLRNTLKDAYRHYQHINTVGLSWNVRSDLATLHYHIDRDNPVNEAPTPTQPPKPKSQSFFQRSSTKDKVKAASDISLSSPKGEGKETSALRGTLKLCTPIGAFQHSGQGMWNHFVFQYLATHYRFVGMPFVDLCDHNAKEARNVKQYQLAQSWLMLKVLFNIDEEDEDSSNATVNITSSMDTKVENAASNVLSTDDDEAAYQHAFPTDWAPSSSTNTSSESTSPPDSLTLELGSSVEDFFLERPPIGNHNSRDHRHSNSNDPVLTSDEHSFLSQSSILPFSSEDSSHADFSAVPEDPKERMGSDHLTAGSSFSATSTNLSATSYVPFFAAKKKRRKPSKGQRSKETTSSRTKRAAEEEEAEEEVAGESDQGRGIDDIRRDMAPKRSSIWAQKKSDTHSLSSSARGEWEFEDWSYYEAIPSYVYVDVVKQLLYWYGDQGDVQTCIAFLLVLGDRIQLDKKITIQWFLSYIELLHRLQMWSTANELIRLCPLEDIRTINQKSTTVHTNCGRCNKPLFRSGWACENCNRPTNPCSLCHKQARGLYVWCQGCGHGGHLQHMDDWFSKNSVCPVRACAHLCSPTPRLS